MATSAIMSYNDGAWHPLAQLPRRGDLVRSLMVEPGWYGETPRIWFGSTICTSYVVMPLSTMRRWLWDLDYEYATNGHLYTSWIDGGLRTVTKDWISCDVDLVIPGDAADQFEVSLMYRTSEGGTWTPATVAGSTGYNSGAHTPGVSTFDFPARSASARIQLRVAIDYYRSVTTPGTARVQAIILKFMERPDDLQQFSRTYELSTYQAWRNGQTILDGLGERVGWLRTLREAAEPLTWVDWMGTARAVHIVDYRAAERPEIEGDKDAGTVTVSLRLQVV